MNFDCFTNSIFTTTYLKVEFLNNFLLLDRTFDIQYPEFLEIELNPNIDINEFKNICHKVCLELKIGDTDIFSIPLRFMMFLNEFEIYNNKIYIKIPFDMFCHGIKFICLNYQATAYKLTNVNNNFLSCKLISKAIQYNYELKSKICTTNYEEVIQFISSIEINCVEKSNEFNYITKAEGVHKGFFIECENVDEINEIQLIINNKNIFNFDGFLVKKKCVKINKNLLYFPFNFDEVYTDRTLKSLEGSLQLSGCLTKLIIKLDNAISKICIYKLGSNFLRTSGGLTGLAYLYEYKYTGHYYEEFNNNGIYESNEKLCNTYEERSKILLKKKIEYKNIIYKSIEEQIKLICCGSLGYIYDFDNYITCDQCDNNFSENWLLMQSNYKKKCPICMFDFSNSIVFKNCKKTFKKGFMSQNLDY
jgi:hypothetical protein